MERRKSAAGVFPINVGAGAGKNSDALVGAEAGDEVERGAAVGVDGVDVTAVSGVEDAAELAGISFLGGVPPGGFVFGDDVVCYEVGWDPGRDMVVFPLDEVLHGRRTAAADPATASDDLVNLAVGFVLVVVGEDSGWWRLVLDGEERESEGAELVVEVARREKVGRTEREVGGGGEFDAGELGV